MAACSMCMGQHFQPHLGSICNLLSLGPRRPCADFREGSALQPNGAQQRGFGFSPRASRIKISAANVGCMALPQQHRSSHHLPSTAMGSTGRTELHGHSWHTGMAPARVQSLIWGSAPHLGLSAHSQQREASAACRLRAPPARMLHGK